MVCVRARGWRGGQVRRGEEAKGFQVAWQSLRGFKLVGKKRAVRDFAF
jgi:hypothetical protein